MSLELWRPIVRRRAALGVRAGIDLVDIARVVVSSEQPLFPIDNVFDEQRGPGGSCWIAADRGEQTILIALGASYKLRSVVVESEQHGICSQAIALGVGDASDLDAGYRELGERSFDFRPYGPSFHAETWKLDDSPVSRLRLRISPADLERRACQAWITTDVRHARARARVTRAQARPVPGEKPRAVHRDAVYSTAT